MSLMNSYLTTAKDLDKFLAAIRGARAPDKFTTKFLEELGFKSTNHRLFIAILKGLKLIDDSGIPTKRYFEFLDEGKWKVVLADGIRDAYEDLFRTNLKANTLTRAEVTGKLKSLTEGKKSQEVLDKMVMTFCALVKLGDFSVVSSVADVARKDSPKADDSEKIVDVAPAKHRHRAIDALNYRIEIILPSTRDQAVYDALFRSLKEHLL